jgi:hypothetical protein
VVAHRAKLRIGAELSLITAGEPLVAADAVCHEHFAPQAPFAQLKKVRLAGGGRFETAGRVTLRRNTFYRAVASTDPRLAKGAGAGAPPSAHEPACTQRKNRRRGPGYPTESPRWRIGRRPRHRADRGTARAQGGSCLEAARNHTPSYKHVRASGMARCSAHRTSRTKKQLADSSRGCVAPCPPYGPHRA